MAAGGIYSVGYNAWKGHAGLARMFDALESEGVTILVDTRHSDFRARYSFDQLAAAARARVGQDDKPMRYAQRPALAGKPKDPWEYTEEGQADYAAMDKRSETVETLDRMAAAAHQGERIALLCACADLCTCHRARWLGPALAQRGLDVNHLEPGEFDYERYIEQGERELYRITPQSALPELPAHSALQWRERGQANRQDYQSPQATQPLPAQPRHILIAGSMRANNAQLNYASALVVRAAEVGAQIHVGDNDQGVDARVVETANSIGYRDVVVWTAGGDPRNGGVAGGQCRRVAYNFKEPGHAYTQRDRTMIRSLDDETGVAFFIDNGQTQHKNGRLTGTEAGYAFAVEQGKAARKVSFGRQQDREAELKPLPTGYTAQAPTTSSPYHWQTLPNAEVGYSILAMRQTDQHGYALELGRFAHEEQASTYTQALTEYVSAHPDLATSTASPFWGQLAQANGLSDHEQAYDPAQPIAIFQSEHNQGVRLLGLAHYAPRFNDLER